MNLNLANPLEAVRSGADSCTSGILAGKRFGAASPDCEKGAEGKSIYADVLNKKLDTN